MSDTWVLLLNDMRSAQVEILQPVYRADSKEKLISCLEAESCKAYRTDNRWNKMFKCGGPLEWFNPPWNFEDPRHFVNVGTPDSAAEQAAKNWNATILPIPELP